MNLTAPLILTLLRIVLIPVLIVFVLLPYSWSNMASMIVFVTAALTDWLDGYIARKTNQLTNFGAFLDPVADKLMVATALVLLVKQDPDWIFAIACAVIIGREIVISALREWMAELGERGKVKVSNLGKLKTIFQMTAISFLLLRDSYFDIPVYLIGQWLLYLAAGLTLWSMWVYLHSAWPTMKEGTRTDGQRNASNDSAGAPKDGTN